MSGLKSLKEIDWTSLCSGRTYYPSPVSWNDETLYFLLVDRFSDGKEHGGFKDPAGSAVPQSGARTTPLFDASRDADTAEHGPWFEAGKDWCGGNLAGIKDKLGYLKRLGITALWLSPVFRQVDKSRDYHGYGIQNFLEIDPHFGSSQDLRDLVDAAHSLGIRVVLDIILNHAGDVFAYKDDDPYYYFNGQVWPVKGFRMDARDSGGLAFDSEFGGQAAGPEQGVWPRELQSPESWTRKGMIANWDGYPDYLDGDFFSLKDFSHGQGLKDPGLAWDLLLRIDEFSPSPALVHLAQVYKYWIGLADVDGFRVDTVKHMEPGAMRYFANVIHEFAQGLGKENFYLIGEVTGGRAHAVNIVNTTGIDAALGVNDIPDRLEFLAKGWRNPGDPDSEAEEGYFDLFRNSLIVRKPTHQWFSSHVVVMFDDHDQVGVERKFRFCGQDAASPAHLKAALALNLLTTGIPCLYYGTEQGFNGADRRSPEEGNDFSDAYLRECMFGGPFGSFQSVSRHFFNEQGEWFAFIRDLLRLRREHIALRRGRQYLRQVSADGGEFGYPRMINNEIRWVVAWSRIFNEKEYLCAVSTRTDQDLEVLCTVDAWLNPAGRRMKILYSTDPSQIGGMVQVEPGNGSCVGLRVPAGGCVVLGPE